MAEAPGSPFVLLERDVANAQAARIVELAELLEEEQDRVAELQGELDRLNDIEARAVALSSGVVFKLDERYARKTGPKPPKAA